MRLFEITVPCHFGLEAVLKREILDLGYEISRVEDSMQELQKQKISLLGYVINASRSSGKSGQGNYGSYGGYGSYGKYGYYGKYGKYGSYGSYGKK